MSPTISKSPVAEPDDRQHQRKLLDDHQPRKDPEVNYEYMTATDLEAFTGTKASTWRYWAHIGAGPDSFKIGRRRVWKKSTVMEWLSAQENSDAASV
jgi:predicted DNA-binding transcriptional regulator AlpA